MQRKTLLIIKNLGFTEELIKDIKDESKNNDGTINRKIIKILREAGTPETALAQIRSIELKDKKNNKELIEGLVDKCKRYFNLFAKKGVTANFIFRNKKWGVQADIKDPAVVSIVKSCQKAFSQYAEKGVNVTISFDGTPGWFVQTKKQSDLPDNI